MLTAHTTGEDSTKNGQITRTEVRWYFITPPSASVKSEIFKYHGSDNVNGLMGNDHASRFIFLNIFFNHDFGIFRLISVFRATVVLKQIHSIILRLLLPYL